MRAGARPSSKGGGASEAKGAAGGGGGKGSAGAKGGGLAHLAGPRIAQGDRSGSHKAAATSAATAAATAASAAVPGGKGAAATTAGAMAHLSRPRVTRAHLADRADIAPFVAALWDIVNDPAAEAVVAWGADGAVGGGEKTEERKKLVVRVRSIFGGNLVILFVLFCFCFA
jgi:hypothetical protein